MAYLDMQHNEPCGAGLLSHNALADQKRGWDDLIAQSRMKVHAYAAHEVIFYEGDPAHRIYELLEGSIMLYKLLPDGRRQVVEVLQPGNLFGLQADEVYDCVAETLTACQVRMIEHRELREVAVQSHINQCMLTQIQAMHEHAVLLGRKSAVERVSSFFMRFVPNRGVYGCLGPREDGEDSSTFTLAMTRQEIADYLGLTIETVSRVISNMRRQGVIQLEKQDRVRLVNICKICQMTGTRDKDTEDF